MYLVAGSNLFGQWVTDDPILSVFQDVSLQVKANLIKNTNAVKLLHLSWSYNIFQIDNSFFIAGSWHGKENQFIKLELPEECKITSDSDYTMMGNDYNLILINRNTYLIWIINLEKENSVKKLSINVDSPVQVNKDANKRMRLDDKLIKTIATNSSCLYLTADGVVYSGLLPTYLDTSHCTGKVCDIACGYEHFVLLTDTGRVYTWGNGRRLQLAHGDLSNLESPTEVEALAGLKIIKISAGGWHSLALSEFGDLYAWGWNDTGQLGVKSLPNNQGVLKTEGLKSYHLPTLVDLFGVNEEEVRLNVKDIACGSRHSAILLEDDSVWVTGCNKYGQLGFAPELQPTVDYFRKVKQTTGCSKIICGPWATVICNSIPLN